MKIFETFECSGQILSNSLCQFWNDKSIPLQILYPSSVSWKITPLYFFSSNNIYFAQKEPIKGVYIKYVGGGLEGFTNFFKKIFVAQETIDLNISWPSNFFRKNFMAPPINFSFLLVAVFQGSAH